jgi:hypothetical protein
LAVDADVALLQLLVLIFILYLLELLNALDSEQLQALVTSVGQSILFQF